MTFEEKLQKIEELSKQLQDPKTELAKAVDLYEEGMKLAAEVETELRKLERRVEIVTTAFDDMENGIVTDQYTN